MNRTQKAIVYLKQKGVDIEGERKLLKGITRGVAAEMVAASMPDLKITSKTTRAELIDRLIVDAHKHLLTRPQVRRLASTAA